MSQSSTETPQTTAPPPSPGRRPPRTARRSAASGRLPRRARRTLLVLHVVTSVGWLGLTLCMLVLGLAGMNGDAATSEAAYRSMKLFADWLLLPLSLTAAVTGLVLALGTTWGLARYHWVWIKFWLTLVLITATIAAFRVSIVDAAAAIDAGRPVDAPDDLVAPPIVSGTGYLFMTVISVLKPWGMTRRGRRLRQAGRTAAKAAKGAKGAKG